METTLLTFGVAVLFAVCGLGVAVMLACVLYRDGSRLPERAAETAVAPSEAEPA